ncbi:glycosyltransferase family 9 protein [Bacteroides heparinolyticus]|uniref:glycosyltransferase family 9 protein n=1 Tax=Prevotella heparinolytica TaxID=28113 RepID=UPI0035A0F8EA
MIIRLQAVGDMAMVAQLLYGVALANPDCSFTLLSQPFLTALLFNPPANMEAMVMDTKREERFVWGVLKFSYRLRRERLNEVIDLQCSWRSALVRTYARLFGAKPYKVHMGRRAAPSKLEQYSEVLRRAGLKVPTELPLLHVSRDVRMAMQNMFPTYKQFEQRIWLGIAPFAQDSAKVYPADRMNRLIEMLMESHRYVVFLFGAPGSEAEALSAYEHRYPDVLNTAGVLSLAESLAIMQRLHLLVAMDSGSPHLAALVGVRSLTIWRSTRPEDGSVAYAHRAEDDLFDTPQTPLNPECIYARILALTEK